MNVRADGTLERVGADTRAIVARGTYEAPSGRTVSIAAAVAHAIEGTHLWREAALAARIAASSSSPSRSSSLPSPSVRVSCWTERSGACASRLLAEGARRVALLNYANGVKPGGGFLNGAVAQEESLCRCSALYACLASTRDDARAFYAENRATESALVTGHVLVSPDVPFFRDERYVLLEQPFSVTVLTSAAPDLGWLFATTESALEPKARFDEVPALFALRTRLVLAAAREAGCDAVVAGPWGCGAFGNDPEVVAEAFEGAVAALGSSFGHIVFSTYGPAQNREAFERRFKAPDA